MDHDVQFTMTMVSTYHGKIEKTTMVLSQNKSQNNTNSSQCGQLPGTLFEK